MLEDILIIHQKHRIAAWNLVPYTDKLGYDKTIVSIGGESGSGKSVVAHVLARLLKKKGVRVKIIHTDNYYTIPPLQRNRWRQEKGIDCVGSNEYDFNLLTAHIHSFKTNEKAVLPCVDLISDQVDQLATEFNGIQMLILEGLYALKAESDLRVFIDLTYQDTHEAQQLRQKEQMDSFRLSVLKQEHKVIQDLKFFADIIINKNFKIKSQEKIRYPH